MSSVVFYFFSGHYFSNSLREFRKTTEDTENTAKKNEISISSFHCVFVFNKRFAAQTTMIYFFNYCIFRIFGFFVSLLSYKMLHRVGNIAGICAFYLHKPYRKKALINLAIAFGETKTEKERLAIAKKSFQNLMITCLEFFRLKKSYKKTSEIASLTEAPELTKLLENKQGIVFLSAHQANWEVPFIALTEKYRGVAIGRPVKNKRLYRYVLSVREMHGGKIVTPKNAIKASLKALKGGEFLGIVGDQAYQDSPYHYPFFGTRAWTASTPALLAYKTGCPLVVGTTKRINDHYYIKAAKPIWPDLAAPIKDEVPKMMDEAMHYLEKSINEIPEQWMWIHNRWKQPRVNHLKRKYRHNFVLIVLPPNPKPFLETLPLIRNLFPEGFLTFFVPKGATISVSDCTVKEYEKEEDLFIRDWRFQLVIDFYDSSKLRRHFLKMGAYHALSLPNMKPQKTLSETLKHHLVRPECHTTAFI